MPGTYSTDISSDEGIGADVNTAVEAQVRKYRNTQNMLSSFSEDQVKEWQSLLDLFQTVQLSTEDAVILKRGFHAACFEMLGEAPGGSIIPYLATALSEIEDKVTPLHKGPDRDIPPLETAPRDTFKGVRDDGNPYEFLKKHYGPWLQEGKKCLDRPRLTRLDARLMKALQQRYTRNKTSMPKLADIFPSKTEAAKNRKEFLSSA